MLLYAPAIDRVQSIKKRTASPRDLFGGCAKGPGAVFASIDVDIVEIAGE